MAKEKPIIVTGIAIEALPKQAMFVVKLLNSDNIIKAYVRGNMKLNRIKVVPGDKVDVALSHYDLTMGIIVHRYNS